MRGITGLLWILLTGASTLLPRVAAGTIFVDVGRDAREAARAVPLGAWTIASAPFRATNLGRTAAAVGALGALSLLDEPIRRNVQPHLSAADRSRAHDFSTVMDPRHEMGAAVAIYGLGLFARLPGVRRAGLHATEALTVNEVFTVGIKEIVGRERPFVGGAYHFRPFSGAASFPSGHATAAFTLATALSRSSGSSLVSIPSYGIAGGVAAARIALDAHWTSDVVAAGYLGYHIAEVFTQGAARPPDR